MLGQAEESSEVRYHLTARPWQPLGTAAGEYLDAIEAACRFTARHQDSRGAVLDPFLRREQQYATPCFALAGALLLDQGRAADLAPHVFRAMDHATACLAGGSRAIPDRCGEFFLAPLTEALQLLEKHAPAPNRDLWRRRLRLPLSGILGSDQAHHNHRRAAALRAEWLRARAGLVNPDAAREFIERNWIQNQRDRILPDRCNLYHDRTSDPESHAQDAAGRAWLLGLAAAGYDGRSAPEIARAVERGTGLALLMQDPSGQAPPNGPGDACVVNDVLYQLAFERMAARTADPCAAGRFRRAALLAFASALRWRRSGGPWEGSWFVTRNRFDPAQKVGYPPGVSYSSANGAHMLHLAECWLAHRGEITEQPAPSEIGGYAFSSDPKFASVFVNAGGMQMIANLRGDTGPHAEWTALGVVRFARPGWDSRLGPSDGFRDRATGRGVSFGPTWIEGGRWVRLADLPDRYQGVLRVIFVHPLLVRCQIDYTGRGLPPFRQEFTVTPDGVLATLESGTPAQCAMTWPLVEDDGRPLETSITRYIASVRDPGSGDQQNFIALASNPMLSAEEDPVRSPCGWLRPVRSRALAAFVYPRGAGDPDAEAIRASFKTAPQGFSTVLGRVAGNLYVGRTAAGGEGKSIDLTGDGHPDVTFSAPCGFILQLQEGRVTAVETDREVHGTVDGQRLELRPYEPVVL